MNPWDKCRTDVDVGVTRTISALALHLTTLFIMWLMAMKHGFKHRFKIPASSATETEVLELSICRQALPRAIWYSNGFWHMQLVVTDAQMTDRKLAGLLQKGKSAGPCSTWQINFLWRLICILRYCRFKTWLGQQQIRKGFHFTKSNCQVIFIMSNVVPAWMFPNQICGLLTIVSKIQSHHSEA